MKTKQHKEPSWRTAVAAAISILRCDGDASAASNRVCREAEAVLHGVKCDDRVVNTRIAAAVLQARDWRFLDAIEILESLL